MKQLQRSLFLLFIFLANFSFAQPSTTAAEPVGHHYCASDAMQEALFQAVPELRRRHTAWLQESRAARDVTNPNNQLARLQATAVYRVPLVVHVIHNGNAGLISDADVQAGVDLLNESFANGANFNPAVGVDVGIEFCLAERDPNGNPSTGVVRVDDPLSSTFNKDNDDLTLKNMSRWDPTRYVNIYTVANIQGGVAGYAYFPSSHGSNVDGIVVESSYMIGNVDGIKVTTHEMGHYLGLPHTWSGGCPNNDCLTQGDGICDTPPDDEQFGACTGANTCTTDEDDTSPNNPFRPVALGGLGDQDDLTSAYMDYTPQSCMEAFTEGQKVVMVNALTGIRASLITPQNLAETGCQCELALPCTPVARFQADNVFICPGQTVNFSDLSVGPAASWTWVFQGGSPSTATVQNPAVTYANPGAYEVSLTIFNGAGNDSRTEIAYITVVDALPPPVAEGFETVLPSDWAIANADGGGTWTITDTTAHTGTQCITMDNWSFPAGGTTDELSTRIIDLSTFSAADFTFDYSYQRGSFKLDTLNVYISPDCGATWNLEWTKGGADLSTVVGTNFFSRFVPTDTSEWDNVALDLTSYLGSDGVKVRFENRGYNGQSLYIDNINLSGIVSTTDPSAGLNWSMDALPNPFRDQLEVNYTLQEKTAMTFSLYDIAGRELLRENTQRLAPGNHAFAVPESLVATLPNGIYLLRGQSEQSAITLKVVKAGGN